MSADSFDPGVPRAVTRKQSGGRWALTFTQVFPHPPAAVWSVLTAPAELVTWAPYTADRNLARVGPATLLMPEGDGVTEFDGEVTLAQPPARLEHAWGRHQLQWRLTAVAAGTEVTLSHLLGPGDDEHELPMMAAGWHICLAVADRYLDGTPVGRIFGEAARDHGFDTLKDAYQRTLDAPSP